MRVDFPDASLGVIHQTATLARHFHPEIVILHVVTALSHTADVPEDTHEQADWDLLAAIIRQAQKQRDLSLGPELAGLTIQRRLGTVDTAVAIMQTAQDQKADLIMMPSHI
ncbi:MAG: universal stress protein [Terriglobia bacterium]